MAKYFHLLVITALLSVVGSASIADYLRKRGETRPKGFGLTAELLEKKDTKYDDTLASEALVWIKAFLDSKGDDAYFSTSGNAENFRAVLKDGVVLVRLANALGWSSPLKASTSKMAFRQMENIGNALDAFIAGGVSRIDLFQIVDLYEGTNLPQVVNGLHAVARKAAARGQLGIGPKESDTNSRDFTQEQLQAGQEVIGLQMRTNNFASQAGSNFWKSPDILA